MTVGETFKTRGLGYEKTFGWHERSLGWFQGSFKVRHNLSGGLRGDLPVVGINLEGFWSASSY